MIGITWGETIGYAELAGAANNFVYRLSQLPKHGYAIVGGAAVTYYVGKKARLVSPDLDVLVNAQGLAWLKENFLTSANTMGLSTSFQGLEIDFLKAKSAFENHALENSQFSMVTDLSYISIECLVYMKFLSHREKDIQDLALLYKWHAGSFETARKLVNRFNSGMLEDFDSEISMLQYM